VITTIQALVLPVLAAVVLQIPSMPNPSLTARPSEMQDGQACKLSAAGGFFGKQTGVIVNGKCEAVSSGSLPSGVEYRTLSCLSDGTAVVHGSEVPAVACDPGMPKCKLLVDGGQSGANPVLAFEEQTRELNLPQFREGMHYEE
jgi:hypothetical protein